MNAHRTLKMLLISSLLVSGAAMASAPSTAITGYAAGTGGQAWQGYTVDVPCNYGPACQVSQTVLLKPGLTSGDIEIFMTRWYYRVTGSFSNAGVSRVKLAIDKTNYDPATGNFTYAITGDMDLEGGAPYEFGIYYTILLKDGVNLDTYQVPHDCLTGTTSSSCSNSLISLGALPSSSWQSAGVGIRSFDVRVTNGSFISPHEFTIDWNAWTPPGTLDIQHDLGCRLLDNKTSNPVACNVDAVSIMTLIASGIQTAGANLTDVAYTSNTWPRPNNPSDTAKGMSGFLMGLEKFDLWYDPGNSLTYRMDAGCYDGSLDSSTGTLSLWYEGEILDQLHYTKDYANSLRCNVQWMP